MAPARVRYIVNDVYVANAHRSLQTPQQLDS